MDFVRLMLSILTLFRLARLLAVDDGPLWVFARLRGWTDTQTVKAQGYIGLQTIPAAVWGSLDEGLRCPYCVGIWLAPLVGLLYARQGWLSDALLVIIGLAGGQALLQGVVKE